MAFAESRIRAETIAAEDILHDMGAISIVSSDSQAMGRIGEVITRTWQTADKMKRFRGRLANEKVHNKHTTVFYSILYIICGQDSKNKFISVNYNCLVLYLPHTDSEYSSSSSSECISSSGDRCLNRLTK